MDFLKTFWSIFNIPQTFASSLVVPFFRSLVLFSESASSIIPLRTLIKISFLCSLNYLFSPMSFVLIVYIWSFYFMLLISQIVLILGFLYILLDSQQRFPCNCVVFLSHTKASFSVGGLTKLKYVTFRLCFLCSTNPPKFSLDISQDRPNQFLCDSICKYSED